MTAQAWVSCGAEFGPLGANDPYRYRLHREWLIGNGVCTFIMLNPSTATDLVLDRHPWHVTLPAGRPIEVTSP